MSSLEYEAYDKGILFNIIESKLGSVPNTYRTDEIEWKFISKVKSFPKTAPPAYKRTEVFWLEPVRVWIAYIFASSWEGNGACCMDEDYFGPYKYTLFQPSSTERRKSSINGKLINIQIPEFRSYQGTEDQNLLSVFVSYGGPDKQFAEMLNAGLQQAGVSTFFFPSDAPPGEKLHHVMRDGVNQYDRVVLVCSRSSLNRPGVTNEIEETLQREAREGGRAILIPVTVDDYVYSDWAPSNRGIAQAVRDRVVGDFRNTLDDPVEFNISLDRVVKVLAKNDC